MRHVLLSMLILASIQTQLAAQKISREQKVRADKARVEADGFWIYHDLEKAYAIAKESGKPILVALRCIPCEECVKLDDDLVDTDPVIRPLLEQFVCVRVVGTNGLDLDTFQYDTDQSFAMFMINADKAIYGRFGTRSHHTEWFGDVSIAGMAKALEGALELHAGYPANKAELEAKRGAPLEYPTPEQYPSLSKKYTDRLNYSGNVVKSCIHCHQIGDARRAAFWEKAEPIPERLLFPYPHPKSVGLILDPDQRASLKSVVPNSAAETAGLKAGDQISRMNGQPLLSMADVQWVLDGVSPKGGRIRISFQRTGESMTTTLQLDDGWRRKGDTSWRVGSWEMRKFTTGGMRLTSLTDEERSSKGVESGMALKVASLGNYGPHGAAKRAGFRKGDVLIEFDGRRDLMRESDLFWHTNQSRKTGDTVKIAILRNGDQSLLELPIQ